MMPSSQIRERDTREASFQILPSEIGHVADTFEIAEALQHRAVLQVLVHDADLGNPKLLPVQKIRVVCAEHQLRVGGVVSLLLEEPYDFHYQQRMER